jgi:hypothetical protein
VKPVKYAIGDGVVHIRGSPRGVVIAREDNGLLKVKWETKVIERVPPDELRLLSRTD